MLISKTGTVPHRGVVHQQILGEGPPAATFARRHNEAIYKGNSTAHRFPAVWQCTEGVRLRRSTAERLLHYTRDRGHAVRF